jgi:hypothetical protein
VADTKISALTAASLIADTNEFAINESGTSKKVTGLQIKDYIGDSVANQSTAAQTPTAATLTAITGSLLTIPTAKLRIGTVFKWHLEMSKTANGTAARNFFVRLGTAGTTADTAILTYTSSAGTAAIDAGYLDIVVTIRGPLSASCIARGMFVQYHDLTTGGFLASGKPIEVKGVTSGTFDATTANLKIGLSVTTGASEVITFEQVVAEAKNL